MFGVSEQKYQVNVQRQSFFVKMVDCLFYLILLASPFANVWIDRETGEGRFLSFLILVFGMFSIVAWKKYYAKWHWAIALNFLALALGLLVDFANCQNVPANVLLISTRQIAIGIFFTLIVYNMTLRDNRNIKRLCYIILFCAVISSLFMILNIGIDEHMEKGTTGIRYAVLGQNSNATARIAACGILIAFMLLISGGQMKGINKFILFIFILICFFALIKSASRGGFLFLMAAFLFCVFTARSGIKKMGYLILIAIALGFVVFSVFRSDMMYERFLKTFFDRDTGGREAIFYNAIEMFKASPLLGYGNFNHCRILGATIGADFIITHNMYTYPLVAFGIIGAIPYFLSFLIVLKSAIRIRFFQYGNCFFVCIVFALLSGLSGNLEYLRDFYIIFGLALALDKIVNIDRSIYNLTFIP